MGRFSKIVRENISGPTKENGMNYGRWYLMDRDIKYVLSKLCDECDTYEKAADGFGMENIGLRKQLELQTTENKRLERVLNTDFSFVQLRTGKGKLANQIVRIRVEEIKAHARQEFVDELKNLHKNDEGYCVVDDADIEEILKTFLPKSPEKVCSGKMCPMQVGYNVGQCKDKDCLYITEVSENDR